MNTTPRTVRPFPWATLDSLTRVEAALLRDVRRWSTAHANLGSIGSAAAQLLGAPVDVLRGRVEMFRADRPFEGGIGVLLAPAGEPTRGCVLVEAEAALAGAVVARALRRDMPQIVASAPPWSPALAGAFSAVLLALARRAHSSDTAGSSERCADRLAILRVGPCSALEAERWQIDREIVQVTLTVVIERDAFACRLLFPRAACFATPSPAFSVKLLERLGATPLAMPVVAVASRATAADVGALRPGDAFMPGTWTLSRSPHGELRGPAWLAPPSSDSGIRVRLADEQRLVLAGGVDPLCGTEEDDMVESNEDGALVSAVGDVPVVVRVEIGEARMAAREWASLVAGDVIALGRRLGDGVVLRAGGIAIARGELVDIEGEVGVRIRERIHGDRTEHP